MAVVDGTPDAAPGTAEHDYTLHYELDESYWQEAPGPDSLDRWFDTRVAVGGGAPVTFNLPLADVTGDGLGTLRLPLYGGYDTEHEVSVSFEGRDLGTFTWSGYTDYEVVVENVDFTEDIFDGDTAAFGRPVTRTPSSVTAALSSDVSTALPASAVVAVPRPTANPRTTVPAILVLKFTISSC